MYIPIIYLIIGFILGKFNKNLNRLFSYLLIKIFIPIVLFMTIMTYHNKILSITILTYIFSLIMYILAIIFFKKATNITRLCFSYYSIGWLGIPVATAIFGNFILPYILASYIGSTLFGATVAIYAVNNDSNIFKPIIKLLTSMPFIALVISLIIKYFIGIIELNTFFNYVFIISKICLSFCGMAILGIWLSKARLALKDIKYIKFSLIRVIVGLITLFILIKIFIYLNLIDSHIGLYLLIIAILPIAVNITVLETYYNQTSKSVPIIIVNTFFCLSIIVVFDIVFKLVL